MSELAGKKFLLVAGASGIAAEIARAAAARGAEVALAGRTPHKLTAVADSIGEESRTLPVDLGDERSIISCP